MESRDPDEFGGHFLVDWSGTTLKDTGLRHGNIPVVMSPKQESEYQHLDAETRLMRAMKEISAMRPKQMSTQERELFKIIAQGIFENWGITPEFYKERLSHLGTPQTLRRG